MFKCENSNCKLEKNLVPPRQPINTIVTMKRPQIYENKILKGKHKGKYKRTEGWEIVKEIKVCPGCFEALTGLKPLKAEPAPEKPKFVKRPRFKDGPPKKKWQNPRKKKGVQAKSQTPEKKKPIVEKVTRLPKKNANS